ncbi:MAG TPA: SGNH/GDSL hydrolase family protein [Gallionella sp.]|nr:SGNH/GDSL hydrolase family protein [Gallionella sp.]
MKNLLNLLGTWVAAVTIFVVTGSAAAAPATQFSSVIAFGDSLSDNGNYYRLVDKLTPLVPQDGLPQLPYFFGRYSNGPVAVELLASNLELPLVDLAVGGALSGRTNEDPRFPGTGLLGQVESFVAKHEGLDDDALYVVWGGANDFLSATDLSDAGVVQTTIANAIGNLTQSIELLYSHGARHFLVPNLPDIGLTPLLLERGAQAEQATQIVEEFNGNLARALAGIGRHMRHGKIYTVDVATVLRKVVANPNSYGFLNTADTCVASRNCILASVSGGDTGFLFWDGIHPTASAHALLALQFAAVLPSDGPQVLTKKAGSVDWLTRFKEKL